MREIEKERVSSVGRFVVDAKRGSSGVFAQKLRRPMAAFLLRSEAPADKLPSRESDCSSKWEGKRTRAPSFVPLTGLCLLVTLAWSQVWAGDEERSDALTSDISSRPPSDLVSLEAEFMPRPHKVAGSKMRFSDSLLYNSTMLLAAAEKEDAGGDVPVVENKTEELGPRVSAGVGDGGVAVGVTTEFSTWKDLFAIFYPSRWAHPFAAGGTLSWLNYRAWKEVPGRTFKVMVGETIIIGAGYATLRKPGSAGSGGFGSSSGASTTATSSGGGGGSSSGESSSGSSTDSGSGGSGSGGSTPTVDPPVEQP